MFLFARGNCPKKRKIVQFAGVFVGFLLREKALKTKPPMLDIQKIIRISSP